MDDKTICQREHDFTLALTGINEITTEIEDALFEAGCDATLSVRSGRVFLTFSRVAPTLKDAILAAINDVRKANIGADVLPWADEPTETHGSLPESLPSFDRAGNRQWLLGIFL